LTTGWYCPPSCTGGDAVEYIGGAVELTGVV
jgi:hypothetical protein